MQTKIWAHRGASYYTPENTLVAFRKAIELGANGIELDVQMTKDGQLVVIHDETINRTSNGKGYVSNYTLAELRRYDFSNNFLMYRGEKIPTLAEVYELIKPTTLTINVELKNSVIRYKGMEEKVLELAKMMEMEERIIYSSFNHQSMKYIKSLDSKVQTGILYEADWLDAIPYAKKIGADALHPAGHLLQDKVVVNQAKKEDLLLHPWTINEESEMLMLLERGVDALITNKPDVARKVVSHYYEKEA